MDTNVAASVRTEQIGKGHARKARKTGQLPGVVYGKDATATPVLLDPVRIDAIFRETRNRNTVLFVDIAGKKTPCLVRDLQRHPLTRKMLHIDLYSLEPGQEVVVKVPVTTSGRAKGAGLGGRIRVIRRDLAVACPWESIPDVIDIDVTPLDIGDFVSFSSIVPPKNCRFVFETDYNVISCYGKKTGGPASGPAEA